jgi:biotin carboxyl carrier protein
VAIQSADSRAIRVVLRWASVLPVAFLVLLAASVAAGFSLLLTPLPAEIVFTLNPLVGPLFGYYYCVASGAAMAPMRKVTTAVVIAILLNAAALYSILRSEPTLQAILQTLVILGASVCAVVRVSRTPVRQQPFLEGTVRIFTFVAQAASVDCLFWFLLAWWSLVSRNFFNLFNLLLEFQVLGLVLTTWRFWGSAAVFVAAFGVVIWATKSLNPEAVPKIFRANGEAEIEDPSSTTVETNDSDENSFIPTMEDKAGIIRVCVPNLGGFTDILIAEVLIKLGDEIAVDSAVVTLESEKATMDLPSPAAGIVQSVDVKVGDLALEGSSLFTLVSPQAP